MNPLGQIIKAISATPSVIGVNGLDCAGKTTFARQLYDAVKAAGYKTTLMHVDDYNNFPLQSDVYQAYSDGHYTAQHFQDYYHNSIHYDRVQLALLKAKSQNDIVILEGVFLFKDQLKDLFDLKVFLPVDPAVAKDRYSQRKVTVGDDRPFSIFDDIWVPAFDRYTADCDPSDQADFQFNLMG